MKIKDLLVLSFIPLVLAGCSSGITPSFNGNFQNQSSPSSSLQNKSSEKLEDSKEGHEEDSSKKQTDKVSNSGKNDSLPENEETGYKLTEHDKKIGVELNENGLPVFKGKNPEDAIISREESSLPNEEGSNTSIYTPTSKDFDTAVRLGNTYIENIKSKDWKKACSDVYVIKGEDCVPKLKSYYKDGNNFTNYSIDKVTGSVISKKSMVISLKDKGYEESQRMTFIKQDNSWKIFIK